MAAVGTAADGSHAAAIALHVFLPPFFCFHVDYSCMGGLPCAEFCMVFTRSRRTRAPSVGCLVSIWSGIGLANGKAFMNSVAQSVALLFTPASPPSRTSFSVVRMLTRCFER